MRLELSAAAARDLRDIFVWTEERFGLAQAARYQQALNGRIREAVAAPTIGRPYVQARSGTRRLVSGRHFIYYRAEGDRLLVIRVLHQRMAQQAHLG